MSYCYQWWVHSWHQVQNQWTSPQPAVSPQWSWPLSSRRTQASFKAEAKVYWKMQSIFKRKPNGLLKKSSAPFSPWLGVFIHWLGSRVFSFPLLISLLWWAVAQLPHGLRGGMHDLYWGCMHAHLQWFSLTGREPPGECHIPVKLCHFVPYCLRLRPYQGIGIDWLLIAPNCWGTPLPLGAAVATYNFRVRVVWSPDQHPVSTWHFWGPLLLSQRDSFMIGWPSPHECLPFLVALLPCSYLSKLLPLTVVDFN